MRVIASWRIARAGRREMVSTRAVFRLNASLATAARERIATSTLPRDTRFSMRSRALLGRRVECGVASGSTGGMGRAGVCSLGADHARRV